MNCPKCQERLRSEIYRNNKYLACFHCEGAWVQKSELDTQAILKLEKISDVPTKLPCPSCDGQFLQRAKAASLSLEYCSCCDGVFFDKGELEELYPYYKSMDSKEVKVDAIAFVCMVAKAFRVIFGLIRR